MKGVDHSASNRVLTGACLCKLRADTPAGCDGHHYRNRRDRHCHAADGPKWPYCSRSHRCTGSFGKSVA